MFRVRNRGFVWARQCAYIALVLLLIWRSVQIWSLMELPLILLYISSVIINNAPDVPYQWKWLTFDILQLFISCLFSFHKTREGYAFNVVVLALSIIAFWCSICDLVMQPSYDVTNVPTAEYTCLMYEAVSFSYLNSILITPGCKLESFDIDFLPGLMDNDSSKHIWYKFKAIFADCMPVNGEEQGSKAASSYGENLFASGTVNDKSLKHLMYSLYMLFRYDYWRSMAYSIITSTSTYITPLCLQAILHYLSHRNDEHAKLTHGIIFGSIDIYSIVWLMFISWNIGGVAFGQWLVIGRHISIHVNSALIASVLNKAFVVDSGRATRNGIGKVMNLISVDIGAIQEFVSYLPYGFSSAVELILCVLLLYKVLGLAATGGILIMCIGFPIAIKISAIIQRHQDELLRKKDIRISIMNEFLNGIRIVKLFSWEDAALGKISAARSEELRILFRILMLNAIVAIIWTSLSLFVSLGAFCLHTIILKRELTPAVAFTSMSLFTMLKSPMSILPWCINSGLSAYTSLCRIHVFLNTENCDGFRSRIKHDTTGKVNKFSLRLQNASFGWSSSSIESEIITEQGFSVMDGVRRIGDCVSHLRKQLSFGNRNYSKLQQSDTEDDSISVVSEMEMGTLNMKQEALDATLSNVGNQAVVHNVNCQIPCGALVVIAGLTGSGKSSLLSGILGECSLIGDKHSICELSCNGLGSVSVASQTPWIYNATVKQNILFGADYEKDRYDKVIFACALLDDLKGFDYGDETEIGEKGVNLSGGQQQRVNLARAAYAKSDIIIMDDPLSAVDAHVGAHIFDNLICGFLKDRTRILATHQLPLAVPVADFVLVLDASGKMLAFSEPKELPKLLRSYAVATGCDGASVGKTVEVKRCRSDTSVSTARSRSGTSITSIPIVYADTGAFCNALIEICETPIDCVDAFDVSCDENTNDIKSMETPLCDVTLSEDKFVQNESKSVGDIGWKVYWFYISACGGLLIALCWLCLSVGIAATTTYQSYALGEWVRFLELYHHQSIGVATSSVQAISKYQILSAFRWYLLAVAISLSTSISRQFFQLYFSLVGAKSLHNRMAKRILMSSSSWFDSTPIGRIINRFAQDVSTMDAVIINSICSFVDCLCGTMNIVTIIVLFKPIILLLLCPIMTFTYWVCKQYLHVSREIKRLESISKSPMYAMFGETLQGLAIVRSFQKEEFILNKLFGLLDNANRCYLYLWSCNRWLNFRMMFMGSAVGGTIALCIVYSADTMGSTAAGLLLIYSLNFTDILTFLARSHADCQINLNSVERIQEYCECIPMEKYFPNGVESKLDHIATPMQSSVEASWPMTGKIEFEHVTMRYPQSAQNVLRDVCFKVGGGQKVGFVGRSGAGKSSLIAALFRTVEPIRIDDNDNEDLDADMTNSKIWVDGVDILTLPLHTIRSRIAIVPQDPVLFKGTIRSNIDPLGNYANEDLILVLRKVQMLHRIKEMNARNESTLQTTEIDENSDLNSLSSSSNEMENLSPASMMEILDSPIVDERGGNFSVGQKQLLCLARAILRKAKILVLDEATANVDFETDILIQNTIKSEFRDSTILCIAHRINTIASYDLVIVMDSGRVAEMGSPYDLLHKSGQDKCYFIDLCKNSGDYDAINKVVNAKFEDCS